MELITVCIDQSDKDAFIIFSKDRNNLDIYISQAGGLYSFQDAKHLINENQVFQVTFQDPRLSVEQVVQYELLLQDNGVLEQRAQEEREAQTINGELLLKNDGNMYWFEQYQASSRLAPKNFFKIIEYARNISDQSEMVKLKGKYKDCWVFYNIGDDFHYQLQSKFKYVTFYSLVEQKSA